MKIKALFFSVSLLFTTIGLFAQVFPLSQNSWSNPDFVKRFLGSYGVLTEKEPQITSDESETFKQ